VWSGSGSATTTSTTLAATTIATTTSKLGKVLRFFWFIYLLFWIIELFGLNFLFFSFIVFEYGHNI